MKNKTDDTIKMTDIMKIRNYIIENIIKIIKSNIVYGNNSQAKIHNDIVNEIADQVKGLLWLDRKKQKN